MAADGELHAMNLEGFWMDVGQPKDFIIGTGLYLQSLSKRCPGALTKNETIVGNVLIVWNCSFPTLYTRFNYSPGSNCQDRKKLSHRAKCNDRCQRRYRGWYENSLPISSKIC